MTKKLQIHSAIDTEEILNTSDEITDDQDLITEKGKNDVHAVEGNIKVIFPQINQIKPTHKNKFNIESFAISLIMAVILFIILILCLLKNYPRDSLILLIICLIIQTIMTVSLYYSDELVKYFFEIGSIHIATFRLIDIF